VRRILFLIVTGLWWFTVGALWAGEGLSTAFANVHANVPLGVPFKVQGPGHKGLVIRNLGDQPVHLSVEVLVPTTSQLRRRASILPDAHWIEIHPRVVDVAPHAEQECEITVTVPNDPQYAEQLYQVMLWSHGVPAENGGLTVSAGLMSRLFLKTMSSSH
jgi:hypothetical protein